MSKADAPCSGRARAGAAVRGALRAACLAIGLGLLAPGPADATSLRFYGNGDGDIDRVKIQIDAPARPADVGVTDFTLEWWMRALPGENASNAVQCDTNDGWINGNIVFDRDVYNAGDHGDFGVSLTNGRVAFGVGAGNSGNTICGVTNVADGVWHHVAVTRRFSDGRLRIYVDGVLDAEGPGNVGNNRNVSYRDNRSTSFPDSDPFLVIGAEKHDAGPQYPSYSGWIDEIRLSTVQRYTGSSFTRPFSPFVPDGSTAALYHLDEGSGTVVGDASGGGSQGVLQYGAGADDGKPPGPEWSSDGAPLDTARRVELEQVVSGLARPVAIAHTGDRLFVVEAAGQILAYTVNPDGSLTFEDTFLDINTLVACCGERGLLGLAFHPNYSSNGYFFVYYTAEAGNGDVVIARYRNPTPSDNVADPSSGRILLTIEHSTHGNHNGGGLAFGPDGYLYAAVGDGGGGGDPFNAGQDRTTLLGKVLRLAVNVSNDSAPFYTVPADNPFVGQSPFRPEIWAWGLRNPWRIAFDSLTWDLFIADVGQGNREEVNLQLAGSSGGENYGWRRMEGTACYSPGSGCQTGSLVLPILDYGHGDGCSITGGSRYRGSEIPTLHGGYLFGDFCNGRMWIGQQTGNGTWTRLDLLDTSLNISTFGEDSAGEVYVADLNGAIYRLVRKRPRLTVTRAGTGTGTVTANSGGLACAPTCSADYEPGSTVTLRATPQASSWFAGWAGACGGTGSCVVEMDGDRSVTATFSPGTVFQFSAPSYTVSEGTPNAVITVQRLVTTAGTATVNYAIAAGTATASPPADADFAGPGGSLTGTLTFLSGQPSKTIAIPIVDDTRAEGPETVLLSLRNPGSGGILGAQPTAVLTIVNHDNPGSFKFSQSAYSASEGSASTQLSVVRSSATAIGSVKWSIVPGESTAVLGSDFTTPDGQPTGTLTFPANVFSQPIPITLLRQGNTLADGPRKIRFTLSQPAPAGFAGLSAPASVTLTITDNDSAGTLGFSPATLTVSEAAGQALLTVTRSQKASGVTVNWAITSGAANFTGSTSGVLSFGADVLSQTIPLTLVNQPGAQGSRTAVVTLSGPLGGAALGTQKTAALTITDDEVGVRFGQAAYIVNEGSGSAVITVQRTGPTNTAATVNYAIGSGSATPSATPSACSAGADYRSTAGTLTFNPGETSKTFTVFLCGDSVEEGLESLTLQLTVGGASPALLGIPATATLTIQENDEGGILKWSAATTSVSEGATQVVLTVTRSGGSAGNVTVGYVIAGGTATAPPAAGADFNGPPPSGSLTGTLGFAANVTSQTLTIPLVNDGLVEPNETFTVTLQNAQGGATIGSPAVVTVTITDNDRVGTVQFGTATATAQEFAASVALPVTRTGSTGALASVVYQITGDTAAIDGPLSGTLQIPIGKSSQPLVIPLKNDTGWDGNSTLTVTLKDPLTGGLAFGTPNPATVTLVDDEGTVQFSGGTFSINEGSGSATITVTRSGGNTVPVTVTYATGGVSDTATAALTPSACSTGADYRPILTGSLTFNPGETSKTFPVLLCGDSVEDGTETLTLRLTGVTLPAQLGPQNTAVLQILENDEGGTLRFSSATYGVTEGTSTVTVTVLRSNGMAGSVSVPVSIVPGGTAVFGTHYGAPSATSLSFGPNQPSASFTIPILNNSQVDGPKTLVIALGVPTGGATTVSPSTTTLTINDNEPSVRFSTANYSVGEQSTTTSVNVWRQGPTGSQVQVTVQSTSGGSAETGGCAAGGDYTAVSTTVTFLPNETNKSVAITLCPDTAVDGTETIALALANPVGATLGSPNTATVTITDNDVAGTLQFAAAAVSVSEAQGTGLVRVTRAGGSASAVTVHWTITGGTAGKPADYTGPSAGSLTFGASQTWQDVAIPIVKRAGAQGPRTITLLLDDADGGGVLGVQTTATLWILDAD